MLKMKIKNFEAADIENALAQISKVIGPSALILEIRKSEKKGLKGFLVRSLLMLRPHLQKKLMMMMRHLEVYWMMFCQAMEFVMLIRIIRIIVSR